MKRLVLLAFLALTSPAAAANPAKVTADAPLDARTHELTITTPALAGPTKVTVILPAGYATQPKHRWPVLYYLHGAQGDNERFQPWYGALAKDFPGIIVAPSGGHFGFYSDWYNGGKGGPPKYETYDITQLLPLIDARYRTIAKRAGRALVGESMGGYGVMTYATRHPDLFTAAVSMSGFLDSNFAPAQAVISVAPLESGAQQDAIYGTYAAQEIRWHGHNPTDLAENLRGMDLQVLTAPGTPNLPAEAGDTGLAADCVIEAAIAHTTTDFHAALTALGIKHTFKEYDAGCHTIPNFQREFTEVLPGIEHALAHPEPAPKTIVYRSIEPRFSVWGWTVKADPKRALEFLQLRRANRHGFTLIGSGTTTVTTPAGCRLKVNLGPAHTNQQDTDASRAAGDGKAGYFTKKRVALKRACGGAS